MSLGEQLFLLFQKFGYKKKHIRMYVVLESRILIVIYIVILFFFEKKKIMFVKALDSSDALPMYKN